MNKYKMNMSFRMFSPLLVLWLTVYGSAAGGTTSADGRTEFTTRMACHGVEVEVRSSCGEKSGAGVNYSCTDQQISLKKNGGNVVSRDLLEKEDMDNFHIATSLKCVSAGSTPYVFVLLDNGGNCNDCEVSALMDMTGKWLFYGDRWFVSGTEKKKIANAASAWRRVESRLIVDEAMRNE